MTYLDPNHARPRYDVVKWVVRGLAVAALLAIGWLALTLGVGDNGATVVSEPASRTF